MQNELFKIRKNIKGMSVSYQNLFSLISKRLKMTTKLPCTWISYRNMLT